MLLFHQFFLMTRMFAFVRFNLDLTTRGTVHIVGIAVKELAKFVDRDQLSELCEGVMPGTVTTHFRELPNLNTPSANEIAGDVAMPQPEETAAIAAASTLSPHTIRQRTWEKRVDGAVIEMRHVQQLLQKYTVEVNTVKRELEELTYTAAALWAANPDELPAQYKDRQQSSLQRANSPASAAGRSSDTTPTKRRGGPDATSPSASLGGDALSGISEVALESVEQTLSQLSPAQRAKVSAALQSLFYAPPAAPSAEVMDGAGVDFAADPPSTAVDGTAQQKPAPPAKSGKAAAAVADATATAATSDGKPSTPATVRRHCIPPSLLLAMKELQARRINLEERLTRATNATAQQLQRFQLLQEELMVSQYGLDAARHDPQKQAQPQQAPSEGVPEPS
ncbi:hypothetical protein CGC21_35640 [Leishmania donovani]|uniref:Uncharacterized protein n=1 Tax=Leishmania donovani TaxID=5661 RepID=A0A504XL99_LEIDO|nr:hypothetical protein CGC21_35640 [Leishmania donovani]